MLLPKVKWVGRFLAKKTGDTQGTHITLSLEMVPSFRAQHMVFGRGWKPKIRRFHHESIPMKSGGRVVRCFFLFEEGTCFTV